MHVTLAIEAPSLADYERALPDGWSSFPQCEAKATLVRTLATDPSLRRDELPAALREVLDDPPPVTAWVPEVHVVGMLVAVHHEHARAGSAAAFLEWMAERNRELLGGAAYAPMLRASTSERLVKNIATAWERLHRGTELAMRGEVERDGSEHTAARRPVSTRASRRTSTASASGSCSRPPAGATSGCATWCTARVTPSTSSPGPASSRARPSCAAAPCPGVGQAGEPLRSAFR